MSGLFIQEVNIGDVERILESEEMNQNTLRVTGVFYAYIPELFVCV